MEQNVGRPSREGDIAFETFYGGAIGGSVIALFYLAVDAMAGHPLLTPSILGSVLFFGDSAATANTVRLDAVAYATIVHFLAFGVFGLLATRIVRAIDTRGGSFLMVATILFVLTEGGFLIAADVAMPGLVARLGQGTVFAGNLLTALTMTWFLRSAHAAPSTGPEEDVDDTMDRAHFPV